MIQTTNCANHNTFGGIIYSTDFETDYRGINAYGSIIASRIAGDMKFDKQCIQNAKIRVSRRKYKKLNFKGEE